MGKKSTIVCTLQIPETYPSAGKITPVNISGEVNSEDTTILEVSLCFHLGNNSGEVDLEDTTILEVSLCSYFAGNNQRSV